ncbi:MAG: glucose-6-phosphate isomerase, partial [Terracoccus sp.]
MSTPTDPTSTAAWARLTELKERAIDLRQAFADDPGRVERMTHGAADLYVDLSKNLVDDDVLAALVGLASEVGLAERRDAMFSGEKINVTENRAVLHTALRAPEGTHVEVDGEDVVPLVHAELAKVYA